jgi:ribonuclease P protein component
MNEKQPVRMDLNEKNVSTKQPTTQTHARIPDPHEHSRRSRSPQKASRQRAQTLDGADSAQAGPSLSSRTPSQRFSKDVRLLRRREFLFLQQRGKRQHSPHFTVISSPTRKGYSRLGITVSRRFGKAVARNRMKRMLREFFRTRQAEMTPARDILIIPKVGANALNFAQVTTELKRTLFFVGKGT